MCPVPLQLAAGSSQCLSYPDLGGEFAPSAASGTHESQVINSGPAQSPHLVKIRYGFYLHKKATRVSFSTFGSARTNSAFSPHGSLASTGNWEQHTIA